MNDQPMQHLSLQIENLLHTHHRLQAENHSLRQKIVKLSQENAALADKKRKAAFKVKRILEQLKDQVL